MSTFLKITLSVLLTAVVVGGGVWYFIDKKADEEKKQLNQRISDLEKQNTESQVTNENPEGPAANQQAISWKTYKNGKYGFNLQYPSTWTITENAGSNYDKSVVSLASPETVSAFNAANGQEGIYSDDISVYYYISVADEAENKENNYGARTIDQLITTNKAIEKIGSVTLGGLASTEVYWGGLGKYYTILTMKDDHLFKTFFSNVSDKAKLTETEKKILSSFQFTN